MEIETMNLMSIGVSMMKVVALITIAIAITGFAIYLAGIACLCFTEGRRSIPTPRKLRHPSSIQLVPDRRRETILSTSHAHIREASPAAQSRF
jgi:hypothetical protein